MAMACTVGAANIFLISIENSSSLSLFELRHFAVDRRIIVKNKRWKQIKNKNNKSYIKYLYSMHHSINFNISFKIRSNQMKQNVKSETKNV